MAARLGSTDLSPRPAPSLSSLDLPAPRLTAPAALAAICSDDLEDRAAHTYGKAFLQVPNLWRRHEGARQFVFARRFAKAAWAQDG